jgi:hypothetical protein
LQRLVAPSCLRAYSVPDYRMPSFVILTAMKLNFGSSDWGSMLNDRLERP